MSQSYLKADHAEFIGPYDQLYACGGFLWPTRPGRMVRKAVTLRSPGRALDAGCGDGKNTAFLLANSWKVDAFDISSLAVDGCRRRLKSVRDGACRIWQGDSSTATFGKHEYDMVVAYGLYHCLNTEALHETHDRLTAALRPGGLFVCATFNDALPLPDGHATGELFLRPKEHLGELFTGWSSVDHEMGIIEEDHVPLVGRHRHSLTWAIYGKPD